jgi:2-polyprenyl-6-methoxyphenol hydroxylase-like FAD-dependent oxidoreductase
MKIQQAKQSKKHAIVIGASMAGLLTARVLSEHFEQVTIIERDQLSEQVEPRKGVPQGQHAHILLMKGETILRELFPDLYEAFARDGAVPLTSADVQWYDFGVWKAPSPDLIESYCGSRPFLEQSVRRFVAARANVHFIDGCEIKRLCANEDHTRVLGVSLVHRSPERHEEDLAADLVVDASGRGSRAPQWLMSLGYDKVEETSVKVEVGYATRIYRRPSNLPLDWKLLIVYPTPPLEKRSGLVFPIEDDCWMVSLAGRLRDYPPADEAGFLEYARSLPDPSVYEAIKEAEPVTPIATYKYAMNRWRHYERMARLPEGLVILGDAVCTFNPVYGQGMSVAALEAKALDVCLRDQQHQGTGNDLAGFPQRFQKAIVKAVKVPWMLATGEDFRYPQTEGKRPLGINLLHWYTRRVNELTGSNPMVAGLFYQVLHLLKPPTVLFSPRVVWAVLTKGLASRRQRPVASLPTGKASSTAQNRKMDAVAR